MGFDQTSALVFDLLNYRVSETGRTRKYCPPMVTSAKENIGQIVKVAVRDSIELVSKVPFAAVNAGLYCVGAIAPE